MKNVYARPASRALPDVGLPEPRVVPGILGLARLVSGAYLRLALGFERVDLRHGDRLVEAFQGAQSGGLRLILAFRHPYGDEPQVLGWVFTRGVEAEARRLGTRLPRKPHAVFVHGYEVVRWGGAFIRWMLPRVGAMPVHHSKLDSEGLTRIRAAIEDGRFPVALAPEGQVSYTSDGVPRLESGSIRLGFQAAERLAQSGYAGRVVVLPVSMHYRYSRRAAASLARLLDRLEAFVGLTAPAGHESGRGEAERLAAALEAILGEAERQYALVESGARPVSERIEAVVEAALDAGERLLGITRGAGGAIERLYRIRQVGWDRVYLAPGEDPRRAVPLRRAVLDRRAGEAWYAMRHMELADLAWYLRSGPPEPAVAEGGAPRHEIVEYAQNLWDFANRLAGGAISGRVDVRPKRAIVVFAGAIDLSARLGGYREDRKAATAAAVAELMESFQSCIKEIKHEV